MISRIRHLRLAALVALVVALDFGWAGDATAAGIVGYRNDTNQVIVVQTVIVVNNVTRRGKPQTLFPGEVALDGLGGTGARKITIYDPKKPTTPLFQSDVTIKDDTLFSVQPETTVMVKGQAPATPKVKLVAVPLPTVPTTPGRSGSSMPPPGSKPGPGTTPPGSKPGTGTPPPKKP